MKKAEKNQEFVENAQISFENAGDLQRKVLAYGDDLMCVENTLEKGAIAAPHSHPHTQIVYIIEGIFELEIEGRKYTVKKGDSIFIKGGLKHSCLCIEKGILLDIFTPMRQDFIKS
jgi:quercetin dioxygenase-like cupin family protein